MSEWGHQRFHVSPPDALPDRHGYGLPAPIPSRLIEVTTVWTDLRFVVRGLRRSPGFVALVVLPLGIALGVATTMFGLVDSVLHPRVPLRDPGALVSVQNAGEARTQPGGWREALDAVTTAGGPLRPTATVTERYAFLRVGSHGDWRRVAQVDPGFFQVTGLVPFLGRTPDATPNGTPGAVISFDLWRRALGGRRDLAGTTVTVEDETFDIVGVLPPHLPLRLAAGGDGPATTRRRPTAVGNGRGPSPTWCLCGDDPGHVAKDPRPDPDGTVRYRTATVPICCTTFAR